MLPVAELDLEPGGASTGVARREETQLGMGAGRGYKAEESCRRPLKPPARSRVASWFASHEQFCVRERIRQQG